MLALLVPLALVGRGVRAEVRRRRLGEAADGGVDPADGGRHPAPTTLPPAPTAPAHRPPRRRPSTAAGVDTTALGAGHDGGAGRHDGAGARRAVRARRRRHRRRLRHRDRHRHPRPGHRRVADPADELRHRQGHLLAVPRRAARPTSCSAATCGSCSATTSSTRSRRPGVPGDGRAGRRVPARRRRRRRPDHGLRPVRRRQRHPVPVGRRQRERPRRPRHVLRHDADLRRAGADADRPAARPQGITEIGLVVADTPSFDDAQEAIKAAADEAGVTIAYETRINKTAAEAEQLVGRPGAEEQRRRGRRPAQLAGRRSSAWPTRASTRASRRRGWAPASRAASTPSPTFGCPAVETGEFFSPTPGPRRHRPARPRLQAGLRRSTAAAPRPTTSASSCGR